MFTYFFGTHVKFLNSKVTKFWITEFAIESCLSFSLQFQRKSPYIFNVTKEIPSNMTLEESFTSLIWPYSFIWGP